MFDTEAKYGPRLSITLCSFTSEDDGYTATNLVNQSASSCGWQSAKHCDYPQELIFHFDGLVTLNCLRILSHERKISSCIDVFIAQPSAEEIESGVSAPLSSIDFVRLGHVRLDHNARTNYSARELKTVGIQRQCSFVKLVLRKPHHNSYNLFQQVGIVALTAHGQLNRSFSVWKDTLCSIPVGEVSEVPLEKMLPLTREEINSQSSSRPPFAGGTHEIARRISELDELKRKAVTEEDYDLADALKKEMDSLKGMVDKIAELEKAKDDAVSREDFARAKEIKNEIQRLQFGPSPYTPPPPQKPDPVKVVQAPTVEAPVRSSYSAPAAPSRSKHDEIKVGGKGYYDIESADSGMPNVSGGSSAALSVDTGNAAWEKKLNRIIMKFSPDDVCPAPLSGTTATEGGALEKELGAFATACLLGKRAQLREAAVRGCFSDDGFSTITSHDPGSVDRLLFYFDTKGHGVNDPVAGVVLATCEAIQKLVEGKLPNTPSLSSLSAPLNSLTGHLVSRTGDNNSRIRENVETTLVIMARSSMGAERIVSLLMADPDKQGKKPAGVKAHVSRINLLTTFVDDFGVNIPSNRNALDSRALMSNVVLPSLQHSNGEVREAAIKLFAKLILLDRKAVQSYFDNIKPAQQSLVEAQVEALQNGDRKVERGPDMTADVSLVDSSSRDPPHSEKGPTTKKAKRSSSAAEKPVVSEAKRKSTSHEMESRLFKTCQFCEEYNPDFTEASLDIHYVRSCPMLCPCPLCDQVTEICTLQEHLVTECELKDMVRECARCREAVTVEDYQEHVDSKLCIEAKKSISVCPLCHAKFKAGMEGWRNHLAKAPGCPNNPRAYDGSGPIVYH